MIARAREKLATLEQQEVDQGSRLPPAAGGDAPAASGPHQADLFASAPHPLVEQLGELDPDALSPRQALELLYRWKAAL